MVPATTRSFISSSDAMKKLYLKLLLLAGLVGAFIFAADRSGLFRPDMINNHEQACWNAFYDFTEENDVDVLLVGNSHLYTGINPNHLSNILGANCFILASSGAPIIDTYYSLKEALKRCTPKLVVVETYGIGDKKVRELKADDLSNMYKSFTSRKDVLKKLVSTPVLFSSDNYLSAWSTSIRNHDFIYKDQDQIKKNREGKNTLHNKKSLELGRFTRFTSGITEESDKLYDELGAVVDGNDFKVNRENYMAIKKIEALCRKRGIPLVYLTVPMYHKHVANYSSWKTIVSRVINHDFKWIDLQDPYDFTVFDRDCFEDTRKENQHITGKGARICDYRLANFIIDESGVTLPDRHESMKWRGLFYNEDGYFEHYSTEPEDKKNFLLCRNANVAGLLIKDCIIKPYEGGFEIMMKLDKRTDPSLFKNGLELFMQMTVQGKQDNYKIPLQTIPGFDPHDHYLLMCNVSDLTGISSAKLLSIGLRLPEGDN